MEPNSEFRLHDNQVNRIQMNHICEEKDKIYSKKDPVIIKKNTLSRKPETKHNVQNI